MALIQSIGELRKHLQSQLDAARGQERTANKAKGNFALGLIQAYQESIRALGELELSLQQQKTAETTDNTAS